MLTELDLGWEELLDPLLDMRFDPRSAQRFLEMLAAIQPSERLDRELVRRLWTIPLLLDRIGASLQLEYDEDLYRQRFVPWEQSIFIELARILGEPYDLSKR